MAVAPALGTVLSYESSTGPSVFTAIGQILNVTGPGMTVTPIETTNLETTGAKTFRPSAIYDGGEVTFTIQYDPGLSPHAAMSSLVLSPALENFKITLADSGAATYEFAGIVTNFAPNAGGAEENLLCEVTIKVADDVTITP